LILGVGVENVTITGPGVIDGNKVPDPQGEEHMRGPHAVLFGDSRNVVLREVRISDAANYAVLLERTSHVEVRGIECTGGWDGMHFRGREDQPCRGVPIIDCEFFTGDDCIAGGYWQDTLIDRCVINSSCNGIRLIGPARNLIVHDCLFYGPGRHEHRTSGEKHRTNMAGRPLPPAWRLDADRRSQSHGCGAHPGDLRSAIAAGSGDPRRTLNGLRPWPPPRPARHVLGTSPLTILAPFRQPETIRPPTLPFWHSVCMVVTAISAICGIGGRGHLSQAKFGK
jgi:hypothetical protein